MLSGFVLAATSTGNTDHDGANMSEWYEIENQEDIEISQDGKMLQVLFYGDHWGNKYVEIPIQFIANVLRRPSPEPLE